MTATLFKVILVGAVFISPIITAQTLLRVGETKAEVVYAEGYGGSPQEAVLRALDAAVSQVNGVRVTGAQITIPVFVKSRFDGHVAADSELIELVSRSFEGTVQSYRIISLEQPQGVTPVNKMGWTFKQEGMPPLSSYHVAKVEATVASYKDDDQSLSIYVSLPIDKVKSDMLQPENIVDAFRSPFVAHLTAINKFNVIDPAKDAVFAEVYERIESTRVAASEQAVLGRQVAADLILSIEELRVNANRTATTFAGIERTIETYKPSVSISYSVLDVGKGAVLLSDSLVYESESRQATLEEAWFRSALNDMAQEVIVDFVNKEFPPRVLTNDGRTVSINRGAPFLKSQDVFNGYYMLGDLIDPSTGRNLGQNERFCCEVRIDSSGDFIAQGTLNSTSAIEAYPIVLRQPEVTNSSSATVPIRDVDRETQALPRADFDIEDEFQLLD